MRRALLAALLLLLWAAPVQADRGCQTAAVTTWNPTGVQSCIVYGEGTASVWSGPGAARNDCLWPWDDCQPLEVRSLDTGLVIHVTPTMFCDCWLGLEPGQTGPHGERPRLIDLDPSMVVALGLLTEEEAADPRQWRVWPVSVQPVGPAGLPDTAMR